MLLHEEIIALQQSSKIVSRFVVQAQEHCIGAVCEIAQFSHTSRSSPSQQIALKKHALLGEQESPVFCADLPEVLADRAFVPFLKVLNPPRLGKQRCSAADTILRRLLMLQEVSL